MVESRAREEVAQASDEGLVDGDVASSETEGQALGVVVDFGCGHDRDPGRLLVVKQVPAADLRSIAVMSGSLNKV